MMLNPGYGRLGMVAATDGLISDVVTPLAEILGYLIIPVSVALGLLSGSYLVAFFGLSAGAGITLSAGAILLEAATQRRFEQGRHSLILLAAAIAETFGYRQLCGLWRLWGCWQWLTGQSHWGTMTRTRLDQSFEDRKPQSPALAAASVATINQSTNRASRPSVRPA
jgi:hypothetical protein